jgi:hypothetical protein
MMVTDRWQIMCVRIFIWFIGLFTNLEGSQWDNEVIDGLEFIEHSVLQTPFFLMSLMRYITPTLDRMYVESAFGIPSAEYLALGLWTALTGSIGRTMQSIKVKTQPLCELRTTKI